MSPPSLRSSPSPSRADNPLLAAVVVLALYGRHYLVRGPHRRPGLYTFGLSLKQNSFAGFRRSLGACTCAVAGLLGAKGIDKIKEIPLAPETTLIYQLISGAITIMLLLSEPLRRPHSITRGDGKYQTHPLPGGEPLLPGRHQFPRAPTSPGPISAGQFLTTRISGAPASPGPAGSRQIGWIRLASRIPI